jgi:hypothetical protein
MARGKVDNTVIKVGGCVKEGLSDILILEFRVFLPQFLSVRIRRCQFDDTSYG